MSGEAPKRPENSVDVRSCIDAARFSPYQRFLLSLCVLIAFLDGFDVQALAVTAPFLSRALELGPAELGSVFGIGSVGGLIGGFVLAPLADRLGRRPLLIAAVLASGALTVCYPLVTNFVQLLSLRFAAGVALGLAITVVHVYSAEIGPRRIAATTVMITTAGFGLGVAATGFLSGWLLPIVGWRSIFLGGGIATIVLGLLLVLALPESVRLMALRGGRDNKIRAFLMKVDRSMNLPNDACFYLDEEAKPGLSLLHVFSQGRTLTSLALWTSFFSLNFVIYVFMQWLPSLMDAAGSNPTEAGIAIGCFKIGGLLGSLLCAIYIDRRHNPYPILTAFLVMGCFSFWALREIPAGAPYFILAISLAGLLLTGPQYATTGLAARLFPTYVRTSGMALTIGAGRIGAMAGPFVVGLLLQGGWTANDVFQAAIAPTLLSAGIVLFLGWREHAAAAKAA